MMHLETKQNIKNEKVFKRILVTGGAGFIGSFVINRLLNETDTKVFNIDKLTYSSDLTRIQNHSIPKDRYTHINLDLNDDLKLKSVVCKADPDLVINLAAETHVDRSLDNPKIFMQSNILGTFNLLEAVKIHWINLSPERRDCFKFIHISTDEVFGSLGDENKFNEDTKYDPRSPYSASKAASDHLVKAWCYSYGLPIIITNCSNNYGPYQFPEKLIPLTILKAFSNESIPLYGDGKNIRDWLHVEDHVSGILLVANKGIIGRSYCIGGHGERSNDEVVMAICSIIDDIKPEDRLHSRLIKLVSDRPGHDKRYSIDSSMISNELGWKPKYSFAEGLKETVYWYINNLDWCKMILKKSGYNSQRLGNFNYLSN
ncbi:dTDP-glucose 4,6-dehydratase [Prochlorococcus sp. MIT 1011]|uniref:dTDP-glucose 4,6-dehydratase n=1 Tax=Prochlorococcus sp. MIT 1011 TaxID=3082520 RepID=UPI0039B5EDB1